jgi:hypothetical protein
MAIAMQVRDDPAMTLPQLLVMIVLGGLLSALAAALYAPALRRRGRTAKASPRLATAREHGV